MRHLPVFGILLGLVGWGGWTIAADPAPVSAMSPLPFDHAKHDKHLQKAKLDCVSCHATGMSGTSADLPPPRSACHGCHLGTFAEAPRRAQSSCTTCHDNLLAIRPDDHNAAWTHSHADAARSLRASCDDCHEGRWCVSCHLDRGPMTDNPHAVGFRMTHGVEARLDPARCSSCHTATMCSNCHSTGALPW